jgi:superfamily II DNA or RNA helicase
MTNRDSGKLDLVINLLAESLIGASDSDILRAAAEHNVDIDALVARVRGLTTARIRAVAPSLRAGYARHAFNVGQTVALRSAPSRVGVITRVTPSNRETRYSLFIDGRTETVYASQLVPVEAPTEPSLSTLAEFHARLTALQLVEPSLLNLYSLQSGRIDFIPYQFRPVLKFIRADRPRLLIADEVGVGKTIEAGLILRELQARRPLRSILVVCSKSLIVEEKWQQEMRRFDEEFIALDGPALRYCLDQTDLDGEWPERYSHAILPFSLFSEEMLYGSSKRRSKRGKGLAQLDPPPRFDLLIVDEAHHARNADTHLHQGLRILADNAEAVLFMTATPVQLGDNDLYSLLNLLRPDLVIDRPTFERMAEPNPTINDAVGEVRGARQGWQGTALAALDRAAATSWGRALLAPSPEFESVRQDLANAAGDEARVRLIPRLEELHSFSSLINRTRRRDIGAFTTRKPQTEAVEFTPAQAALHDATLEIQKRVLSRVHGSIPLAFLMTTIRRQAASSLHGLVPFLETILTRRLVDLDAMDLDSGNGLGAVDCDPVRAEIAGVLASARSLPPQDPKLDRLRAVVAEKEELLNNKLLVFSSFRHTLAYLERALKERGVRAGLIHGDVPDEERRRLRAAFAAPRSEGSALDVLLSSEVGSEGLDYQFCDAIVNYDIPWNPMSIEQRIGRIDRYGQQSETVVIYNFVTPGTVEFDIYDRCLLRIGIFERTIGGSEAILGEIADRITRVADDFSLSPDERRVRLQQLADNEIRHIAESEQLEERELEFFGLRFARRDMDDAIAAASNAWLEPAALERLVAYYLEHEFEAGRSALLGQGSVKTLRLSAEARRRLAARRTRISRLGYAERGWEAWLRGSQPTLSLTFAREAALDERSLAFITPVHPLTQTAAQALAKGEEIRIALAVSSADHAAGTHQFALYRWRFQGLKEDAVLVPIIEDSRAMRDFMQLLKSAREADPDDRSALSAAEFDVLDAVHHELWEQRRAAHAAETGAIARFRRDSLQASHDARMATLRDQLAGVREERIRRMREAQISRAESEYRQAIESLERAETAADILFRRVAIGTLKVVVS